MQNYLQIIVESPKGASQKFDRDAQTGEFTLAKLLPKGMVFPYDFGFIPATLGEDGDPLDVIIIGESPTFTGCRINCRIIGSLVCQQTERDGAKMRNDRYIGIADISQEYATIQKLSDLPPGLLSQLESFFVNYNALANKKFEIVRRVGSDKAMRAIENAREIAQTNVKLELLLPISDVNGKPYPESFHIDIREELIARFGGLTAYSRVPVEGFWQPGDKLEQQSMIVYEILLAEFDSDYWIKLKSRLERKFAEQEILIVYNSATKV